MARPAPGSLVRWCLAALLVAAIAGAPSAGAEALSAWEDLPALPQARMEAQGIAHAGKLYIFGGFANNQLQATARVDVYDPATRRWARLADMPAALTHAAVASDGATIWVVGGYVGANPGPSTQKVWRYDVGRNTWGAGPALPKAVGGGGAVVVGGTLYHLGGAVRVGRTNEASDVSEVYALDLNGGTAWRTVAALPQPRNHVGVTTLGGKIYVVGGQLGKAEATTSQGRVDVYDPATQRWARAADIPSPRSHISSSTVAYAGKLYSVGGSVNGGSSGLASADVFAYDPAADAWARLRSLPASRKTPVADVIDGVLYVASGNQAAPTTTFWASALADAPTPTITVALPMLGSAP